MAARGAQPIKSKNPTDDPVRRVFADKIHNNELINKAMNALKDAATVVTSYPVVSNLARRLVQSHVESV